MTNYQYSVVGFLLSKRRDTLRKSSKDCRADRASVNSRIQAEADEAIKAPPVMSFSAQMPAYTYTSLCPDSKRRKPPATKSPHYKKRTAGR